MRVIVRMEIETADYGGKEFKAEIEKLISDIDKDSKLIRFTMRDKYGSYDDERAIYYKRIEENG